MASTPATFPVATGVITWAGGGAITWGGTGNIYALDAAYATAGFGIPAALVSYFLGTYNYGFAGAGLVPAGATIDGVILKVEHKASGAGVIESDMRFYADATAGTGGTATNLSAAAAIPTSDTAKDYGSSSAPQGLSAAIVRGANFGGGVRYKNTSFMGRTVSVDAHGITVYYTPAPSAPGAYFRTQQNLLEAA